MMNDIANWTFPRPGQADFDVPGFGISLTLVKDSNEGYLEVHLDEDANVETYGNWARLEIPLEVIRRVLLGVSE